MELGIAVCVLGILAVVGVYFCLARRNQNETQQ